MLLLPRRSQLSPPQTPRMSAASTCNNARARGMDGTSQTNNQASQSWDTWAALWVEKTNTTSFPPVATRHMGHAVPPHANPAGVQLDADPCTASPMPPPLVRVRPSHSPQLGRSCHAWPAEGARHLAGTQTGTHVTHGHCDAQRRPKRYLRRPGCRSTQSGKRNDMMQAWDMASRPSDATRRESPSSPPAMRREGTPPHKPSAEGAST